MVRARRSARRVSAEISYAALGAAGLLAAAVAMATTSWLIVRTAAFVRWLAWVGASAAIVVIVANVALVGMLAIPAMLICAVFVKPGTAHWPQAWQCGEARGNRRGAGQRRQVSNGRGQT